MKVSVIIPSYNGAHKLESCMRALLNQTQRPDEIIIVLDGSTDNSFEICKVLRNDNSIVSIINQSNKGRAGARNAGVDKSNGELLLFVDDDMRLEKDSLKKHIAHHKVNMDTILVGNQVEDYSALTTDIQRYKARLSRRWGESLGEIKTKLEYPFITAANFSILKSLFLELGRFDDNLSDQEDYDLAVRAFHHGTEIYWDPNIIGWHDDFITCRSYIKRCKEYAISKELIIKYKPEIYNNPFQKVQVLKLNKMKRIILSLFNFKLWVYIVDNFNVLLCLPKKIRYKIYEIVIMSHAHK